MPRKKKSDPPPDPSISPRLDEASSSTQIPKPLQTITPKSWAEIAEEHPQFEATFQQWLQFQQALTLPGQNQVLSSNLLMSTPSSTQTQVSPTPICTEPLVPSKRVYSKPIPKDPSIPVSQYIRKTDHQTLLQIEPDWFVNNPILVAQKVFPSGFNFCPTHPNKSREFYESILVDTQSIIPKNNMHSSNAYYTHSTYNILQVLKPSDWPMNPNNLRPFSRPSSFPSYSYWDYQQAWINCFTYQNPENKHSCLFFFKKNQTFTFPIWFNRFWAFIGPNESILPPPVKEGFDLFVSKFSQPNSTQPITLQFFSRFALPWIFQWRFEFAKSPNPIFPPTLVRQGSIKWWDAYNASNAHPAQVQFWFAKNQQFLAPSQKETAQFLLQKSSTAAALASAPTKDEYIKQLEDTLSQLNVQSSGSSVKKSKRDKGKQKKKQKKKKRHVSSSSSDSTSTSEDSTNSDNNFEDFAESQT